MDSVNIKLSIGGTIVLPVHPVFGDDVKLKISQADNQIFYRTKIDGKIIFSGADFDLIDSCNDEVEFTISVLRGNTLIGKGKFIKPDCTLNYDDKTCEVKLSTTDRYEKIMAGLDNKYNLVKLAPKIESLLLVKRPILQFYALGDKKITNTFGNMSYEADTINEAESKNETDLVALGFTNLFHRVLFDVSANQYIPTDAQGEYRGLYSGSLQNLNLTNDNGYKWKYLDVSQGGYRFALYDSDGNVVTNSGINMFYFQTWASFLTDFHTTVTIIGSASGGAVTIPNGGSFYNRSIFGRLLIDKSTAPSGWADQPIAISSLNSDIYDNSNSNYTYVCGISSFAGRSNVVANSNKTTTPTKYYYKDGKYYVEQTSYYTHGVAFPVGPSMWADESYWYISSPAIAKSLDEDFGVYYTLKDAFPLYSAIQVLLAEIAPEVTYDPTLAIHEFFRENYTTASLRQMPSAYIPSPRSRGARLYITPITNVKKTRYEQAAQRGDITLKQILDMLRNVYGCYWWIDEDNQFRIEHISYFKHNNAYLMGKPEADIDVTAMKDMPNGLSWAFGTNEVEHDRKRCPIRYEFEWGDVCTEQFNGYAIDIEDRFADPDTKEKVNVTNFTPDIDFCVTNPQAVSDDIYALIEANLAWMGTEIPEVHIGGVAAKYFYIQNGYCSFMFAEANYLNYDLGGWKAKANGYYLDVRGVRQYRKQTITFPMPIAKIADIGAVKTNVGIGLIKEQEINADTLMAKSQITLEGEKDHASDISVFQQGTGPHGSHRYVAKNNDPHNYLQLTYYGKDSVTPSPWSTSEIHTVTLTPNTTTELGYYNFVKVLSVRLAGTLQFDEFVNLGIGDMTLDNFHPYLSGANFVLNGHGSTSRYDWCYICVTCKYRTRINLYASTESGYYKGYVAHKPIVDSTKVNAEALVYASGTSQAQYIAEAGEVVYIGYSKDISNVSGDDTITVEIEVPE